MKPIKIVSKPWGQELWVAHTDNYALKLIEINKGNRSSLQYHVSKCEHIYIDSGEVLAVEEVDGKLTSQRYYAGDVIYNPPGKKHRVEAITDIRLIEVSTPQLDDVVRLDDDYER